MSTYTITQEDRDHAMAFVNDIQRYRAVADGEPAEASDGCAVEADGVCEHGRPSPMLTLGLI